MNRHNRIGSIFLVLFVLLLGVGLAAWKYESIQGEQTASANQPEPMESVTVAVARAIDHRPTTTSIGTVLALRSVTLKNELAGTVRDVRLVPGQIVEAGTLLVALDVSVEEAELKAQEAQAALAKMVLDRRQDLREDLATTQEEVHALTWMWHRPRWLAPRLSLRKRRSAPRSERGWASQMSIPANTWMRAHS
jgi:membrane fusion protein, multidrug efflux system